MIPLEVLLDGARNTITFEKDDSIQEAVFKLFSTNHSPESSAGAFKDLLCCLPRIDGPQDLGYDRLCRVIIIEFIDAHTLELCNVKKSCVHIVHPKDGRLIPFDTYNLFYRDTLEADRLARLRRAVTAAGVAP